MNARKSFTPKQRQAIYSKTQGRCAYCGNPITIKQMQVDHIIAVEHANTSQALNEIENLFPACRQCNYIKSTMCIEKFRLYVEGVTDTLERDSVTYRNAIRWGRVTVSKEPFKFYFERIGLTVPKFFMDDFYNEQHEKMWANAPSGAESETADAKRFSIDVP